MNLAAFIGVQSLGLGNLTHSGSDIGQAGAAISLPIFEGGRLQGAYRGARADYDAAVAAYDQTLVQALQQVADAAAGQRALQARLAAARDALASGEQAYRVARLRYEGGLTSYLTLLTAEDAVWTGETVLKYKDSSTGLMAGYIEGVEKFEALDDLTLRITWTTPKATALANLQPFYILPRHVFAEHVGADGKGLSKWDMAEIGRAHV